MTDQLFELRGESAGRRAVESCASCRYLLKRNAHQSGPPKIVYRCALAGAGKTGNATATRLRWWCRRYERRSAE